MNTGKARFTELLSCSFELQAIILREVDLCMPTIMCGLSSSLILWAIFLLVGVEGVGEGRGGGMYC